ncbi:hypothetical protein PR048_011040 [Dryococelus australis]|uniref:Uncharacterized protein n=1 Tax=Dryococelus australis TaxID=614101 RepID=A0ABQ9HL08_9NEOP|nr:hypothetical protein PR048_011040 [Dryococelus australis]
MKIDGIWYRIPMCNIRKDTAKKMWEALNVAYEDTGANIVSILLERLFDIKLKRC